MSGGLGLTPQVLPTARQRQMAWAIGVVGVCLYGVLHGIMPPLEGDSFDYADVARSWVEDGELVQSHLRFPGVDAASLPAPAGRRATLSAAVMAPLVGLLGPSALVVVLPFLLALLVLPRLCLLAVGPMLGMGASLVAAAFIMLHPRLLQHYVYDPGIEPLMVDLALVSVWAFRRDRMVFAGIALGLAVWVKANVAVLGLVFFAVLLLHRRHRLRQMDVWVGALAAVCVLAPFVAYLAWLRASGVVFGESAMLPFLSPDVVRGYLDPWFTIPAGQRPLASNGAAELWEILGINTAGLFWGREMLFGTIVGLPETLGWLWLPWIGVGLAGMGKGSDRTLVVGLIVGLVVFHMLVALFGTDARMLLLLLPFTGALAVNGLRRVLGLVAARRVLWGVLLLESAVAVFSVVMGAGMDDGRSGRAYAELRQVEGALAIPDEGTLVAMPFLSTSFYTGYRTVPLPLGPVSDVLRLAEARDAKGLLIMRQRPGACLPWDPALPLTWETEHLCLYRFERAPKDIAAEMGPELSAFEPLRYQVAPRAYVPTPFRSLVAQVAEAQGVGYGVALGLVLLLLMLGLGRLSSAGLAWGGCTVLAISASFVWVAWMGMQPPPDAHARSFEARALDSAVGLRETMRYQGVELGPAFPSERCGPSALTRTTDCPAGLEGRRCGAGGRALVVGCPPWDGARGPTTPAEARALTVALGKALDDATARLQKEGREVLRFNRHLVALPRAD